MVDWIGVGLTVGGILGGQIVKDAYFRGKNNSEMSSLTKRVDDHDDKLNELAGQFVTRDELSTLVNEMRDGQKRTNNLLDKMLFRMAKIPD